MFVTVGTTSFDELIEVLLGDECLKVPDPISPRPRHFPELCFRLLVF